MIARVEQNQIFNRFDDSPLSFVDETELESSYPNILARQKREHPNRLLGLRSEQLIKMDEAFAEICGEPRFKRGLKKLMWMPTEIVALSVATFLYDSFESQNMGIEKEALKLFVLGWLGRTPEGGQIVDFSTYDGKPSALGKLLEDVGLVKLKRRQLTHGEVFTNAIMDEAGSGLAKVAKRTGNYDMVNGFMETLYKKGEEIDDVIRAKYPSLNSKIGHADRVLETRAAHKIGKLLQKAIARDGIDGQGNMVFGGKIYNINDKNDVATMINSMLDNTLPLEVFEKPGANAGGIDSSKRHGTPEHMLN